MVSFGFSILLVDQLDKIQVGGFKLGFWFAQQGSIFVFVILIFIYIYLMNKGYPTPDEKKRLTEILDAASGDDRRPALEDLYWSVLSSKEFLFTR